jgi:hypothetical protein
MHSGARDDIQVAEGCHAHTGNDTNLNNPDLRGTAIHAELILARKSNLTVKESEAFAISFETPFVGALTSSPQ